MKWKNPQLVLYFIPLVKKNQECIVDISYVRNIKNTSEVFRARRNFHCIFLVWLLDFVLHFVGSQCSNKTLKRGNCVPKENSVSSSKHLVNTFMYVSMTVTSVKLTVGKIYIHGKYMSYCCPIAAHQGRRKCLYLMLFHTKWAYQLKVNCLGSLYDHSP